MKLSFKSFGLLSFGLLLAACTDNEGLSFDEEQPNNAKEVLTWGVHLLSHGTGNSINADNTDNEDKVENIVLAGSVANAYSGGTSATFGVTRFLGKKNFFFAANLNAADKDKVGAGHTETEFNNVVLNTTDYLRAPIGPKDAKAVIPMTATLRDVQVDAAGNFKMFDKKDQLVDASQVELIRAFAKVELEMANPGNFPVEKIVLCNVPEKFGLAAPIQNYDKTSKGYMTEVVLYSGAGSLSNTTAATEKKTFYVPELAVSAPSFHEQDARGMMYVAVYHTVTGKTEKYITAYRIADPTLGKPNYGKVLRNHIYKLKVQGSDAKRTSTSTTTPVTYFAN